jgi:hypothetical protein
MAELMAVSAPSRLWVTGREAQTTRRHLAPSPLVYVICGDRRYININMMIIYINTYYK